LRLVFFCLRPVRLGGVKRTRWRSRQELGMLTQLSLVRIPAGSDLRLLPFPLNLRLWAPHLGALEGVANTAIEPALVWKQKHQHSTTKSYFCRRQYFQMSKSAKFRLAIQSSNYLRCDTTSSNFYSECFLSIRTKNISHYMFPCLASNTPAVAARAS
jgi:hypothetical protein